MTDPAWRSDAKHEVRLPGYFCFEARNSESLGMIARICTQLLDVVQYSVFKLSKYLRSFCTSVIAIWRPDGITYLIAHSCLANELSFKEENPRDDSHIPGQTLAHMLLERVVWITETIVPVTGQERS